MTTKKKHINVVILGHRDSGKSTSIGHLIYKCNAIDQKTVKNFENETNQINNDSLNYAWIIDNLKASRERSDSVDLSQTQFETKRFIVTVVDVPGHKDFMKNMITGLSQVDCAVLFVSAKSDEFEYGISNNGETREHISLAYTLGIKHIIVVVNKMDTTEPTFSEKRFYEIKNELSNYLNEFGYQSENISFIPISGLNGDNIIQYSLHMDWYNNRGNIRHRQSNINGKTLLEAFDAINLFVQLNDKPLRLPIQTVYKIGGIGTVPFGRVETGMLKAGMTLCIAPVNIIEKVQSIETCQGGLQEGFPGDNIGFHVGNVSVTDLQCGYVCSDANSDPARETISFIAHIIIFNYPDKICEGYTQTLDCHTCHILCKFDKLISKIHRRTGRIIEQSPKYLRSGESALVKIIPMQPMCVEKFSDYPSLGRFAVYDMRQIVIVGVIKEIEKKFETSSQNKKRNKC